jgi:hypothetical protein
MPAGPPQVQLLTDGQAAVPDFAGCVVREQPMPPGPARFAPPDFAAARHGGRGVLNIVVRRVADEVDVWAQVHHAALDGVPLQELLGRLRERWGTAAAVTFPTPEAFEASGAGLPRPCHRDGERPVDLEFGYVDFAPLLRRRKEVNARIGGGGITVGGLLVWELSREAAFDGLRFATTVETPALDGMPRGVNFASARPADFSGDLAAFAPSFAKLVEDTRARRGPGNQATDALGLLPSGLLARVLAENTDQTNHTFGTIGLSIIKDAEAFVAPIADHGFADGFIAVGGMNWPTADGRRVASVSVKKPAGKPRYLPVIRRVVEGGA